VRRVAIFFITILLITQVNAEAMSNMSEFPSIHATGLEYAELPDKLKACLDESWQSSLFIVPNEWVQGEVLLENVSNFPVVSFAENQMCLLIFEKSKDSDWSLICINPHALQTQHLLTNITVSLIDKLFYDPIVQLRNGSVLDGMIHYTYGLSIKGMEYIVGINIISDQTKSTWNFDSLQVIMPQKTNSSYLPWIEFDNWYAVRIDDSLQYVYSLDENTVASFSVEWPSSCNQADVANFSFDQIIDPIILFLPATIDTERHGNGGSVNIRSSPNGKKIDLLPNGAEILVSNLHDRWILVRYLDTYGYVDSRFVVNTEAYNCAK